jgi:hypothetical protein
MATSTRERAIKLLGQNIQQSLVASAIGVSESYISQLLVEEGVAAEIAQLKAASLEAAVEKDETIESLEKSALAKIKSQLTYVKSPLEAARVFQILNNAKKATQAPQLGDSAGVQIVQITLPAAARGSSVRISLNTSNQVIDVEGRSMAPLPSKALPQLAKRLADKTAETVVVKQPLPPTTAKSDSLVAAEKLNTLRDITTVMDGVQLVL